MGVAAGWIIHNVEARIVVTLLYRIPHWYFLARPFFYTLSLGYFPLLFLPASFSTWAKLYIEKPLKKSLNAIGSIRAMKNFQVFFFIWNKKYRSIKRVELIIQRDLIFLQ